MTKEQLQGARKRLFIETPEAAEALGISLRYWQFWEKGQRPIPAKVEDWLLDLLDARRDLIAKGEKPPYFADFNDYLISNPSGDKIEWRIYQSVAAHFFDEDF